MGAAGNLGILFTVYMFPHFLALPRPNVHSLVDLLAHSKLVNSQTHV